MRNLIDLIDRLPWTVVVIAWLTLHHIDPNGTLSIDVSNESVTTTRLKADDEPADIDQFTSPSSGEPATVDVIQPTRAPFPWPKKSGQSA